MTEKQPLSIKITASSGSLLQSVEIELPESPILPPARRIALPEAAQYVMRYDKQGRHVATLDSRTGLEYADGGSDRRMTPDEALTAARNIDTLGGGWQLSSIAEAIQIMDYTRHKPAVDPEFFPWIKSDIYWMRDNDGKAAWSSASAWFVDFGSGYVGYDRRDSNGFALAVRRAGQ